MAHFASHREPRGASLPDVPRPAGRIWHSLAAESIRWEGQVLIVGEESDLPALLVTTRERVALIVDGDIALEIPRVWLRPAPQLAAENGVRLFISPEGADEPSPMLLRARLGRGAAAELVAVLTGRALPLASSGSSLQIPSWKEKVGASVPVALPPIEDDEASVPARRPSWPPVEQEGVDVRAHRPATPRRGNLPAPGPVPVDISRAARAMGTEVDGFTVAEDSGVPTRPAQVASAPSRSRNAVAWTLRAAILLVLVGTIAYFGRDRLEAGFYDVRDRLPSNIQRTLGVSDPDPHNDMAFAPESVGDDQGDGTNGAQPNQDAAPEPTETPVETEVAQVLPTDEPVQPTGSTENIGGATGELPPTMNAEDLQDPTQPLDGQNAEVPTTEPEATDVPVEPTEIATEAPTEVPTEEPTEVPTEEPTEIPTEEPTVEPTAVPTEEPTIEPTQEPTVEPTEAPTEAPTVEPTVVSTPEPTEAPTEAATQEPTAEPTAVPTEDATETPTIEPQAPSVEPESTPDQAVVSNGFRYTVEGASVGATVPDLPQINSVGGYGEWVVLNVYGQNMSLDPQVFDMSSFRLYADGQELLVDVGNAWVSGLLGNTPAYGNTDAVQWAAGESHRFTLTFLAPPDAQTLVLQAGDQTIDLSPALQDPAPLTSEGTPVESDLIEAKVVDVIDGETIVVEIDGVQQTVRYLSVKAPRGDACYAAEAAEANRELVAGATVMLERQSTNVDAQGNWVRDVWLTNDAGQPVLVSQQLVLEGAAQAKISDPNTRFAGWLESSQANAQDSGVGMWASCGE